MDLASEEKKNMQLEDLIALYDDSSDIVYVADVKTYELIYINKLFRERFGIGSLAEAQGRKCYELIQNFAAPCAMCSNCQLSQDRFYEWEFYNPIIKSNAVLRDKLIKYGNRLCRIEICDVTRDAETDYTENESIVILDTALKTAMYEPDAEKSIQIIVEYLARAMRCDRGHLVEVTEDSYLASTYEWRRLHMASAQNRRYGLGLEIVRFWREQLEQDRCIVIDDVETVKEHSLSLYSILKQSDVGVLAFFPVFNKGKLRAFISFDNPDLPMLQKLQEHFKTFGHFVGALLINRDLVRRLENISYIDQLTGFGNRYAVEKYYNNINSMEQVGVVLCDMNGLKIINDFEGHEAGDAALRRTATIIGKVFSQKSCFRIGGDEFLIIKEDVTEEELRELILDLQQLTQQHGISLAIGVEFCIKVENLDINAVIKAADMKMYADKRAYYLERAKNRCIDK